MRAAVHELERLTPPFNWQREYAPLWEGRNEGHLNDILFGPEATDVLTIDGVTAPWWYHQSTARARKVRVCSKGCGRVAVTGWRYCRECYDILTAARKGRVQ